MLYIETFKDAMKQAGTPCLDPINADGRIHRYRTEGDHGSNCWYVLYADAIPAGAFGCWKRGISERWCAKDPSSLSEPERIALHERMERAMAQRAQEQDRRHQMARERALKLWQKAKPETGDHLYLVRKGVKPHGIRTLEDLVIIIPMYDTEGVLQCLQLITPMGKKQFMHGGKVSGHCFMIGTPGKVLCIAEGFATAASIHEATGYAVAVAFTANNLKPVAEALRKKYPEAQLIICGDNDQWTEKNPGITKALEAAQAVLGLVAIPQFKETTTKPTDFNDLACLQGPETVKKAIDAATSPTHSTAKVGRVVHRNFAEIKAKPIRWLWGGRIARGKVSLIAGHPGLGKSQITASLAAIVSTGGSWPVDRTLCERGSVVMLSAEDTPEDTIRPRLEAAEADLSRINILEAVRDETGNGERSFNLKTDLDQLGMLLKELGDVALVVIDPISAYLGNTDSHKNADMRALLAPLGKLAARYQVAIVCVSHLNKYGGAGEAQLRVTGSLAFVAAARAAFIVARDPKNPRRRLLLPAKNNLSRDDTGLAFTVDSYTLANRIETSRVMWEAEAVTGVRADEILELDAGAGNPTQCEAAKEWLIELLSDGPLPAKNIRAQADEAGLAWRTVRRAKDDLAIKPKKESFEGGWTWELPPNLAKPAQDVQPKSSASLEDDGHLPEPDSLEAPPRVSQEVSVKVASNE